MLTPAARSMLGTNAAFLVASGVSVFLRVYARKMKKMALKMDDYLIFAAWV